MANKPKLTPEIRQEHGDRELSLEDLDAVSGGRAVDMKELFLAGYAGKGFDSGVLLLAEEYGFRSDVIAEIKDQWGHGMQNRDSAMRLIESMVAKEYRDHP